MSGIKGINTSTLPIPYTIKATTVTHIFTGIPISWSGPINIIEIPAKMQPIKIIILYYFHFLQIMLPIGQKTK